MTSVIGLEIDGAYRQVNEGGYWASHGSPLVRAENNGTTQVTRAVPLDSTNGNPDNPLLWRDAILGKNLTLDFNGMGPVAKYTSYVSLPSAIPSAEFYTIVSLRDQFNTFFVYHADSDFLEDVTSIVPDGCSAGDRYGTGLIVGGGIVSDLSGNYALGIYANNSSTVGNSYVELGKYLCSGQHPEDFTTLDIEHDGPIPAGESTYNSYFVTGSLDDVKGKMRQLYIMGAK
jgi:hypothetical protein